MVRHRRGFHRSFVMLDGAGSHFADMSGAHLGKPVADYRENGEVVTTLPDDFYSSDAYTSKSIEYIAEALANEQPFFVYLAFTAPHWPLHVPSRDIDRFSGRYASGYDTLA